MINTRVLYVRMYECIHTKNNKFCVTKLISSKWSVGGLFIVATHLCNCKDDYIYQLNYTLTRKLIQCIMFIYVLTRRIRFGSQVRLVFIVVKLANKNLYTQVNIP